MKTACKIVCYVSGGMLIVVMLLTALVGGIEGMHNDELIGFEFCRRRICLETYSLLR